MAGPARAEEPRIIGLARSRTPRAFKGLHALTVRLVRIKIGPPCTARIRYPIETGIYVKPRSLGAV